MFDPWVRQAESLRRAEAERPCEPPEAESIALTPGGSEIYPGDEIVRIDGDVYLLDDLSVSDLLAIIGVEPEIAGEEL